jgi:hypothetical protein
MGNVGAVYRDGMAADWVRLACRDERWLACGGYSIALRCTRSDNEPVVDGRLDVHGCCCCMFFLFVCGRCRYLGCAVSAQEVMRECVCFEYVQSNAA